MQPRIQLRIIKESSCCLFDKCEHAAIVILDRENREKFIIDYPYVRSRLTPLSAESRFDRNKQGILLYSNKSLRDFVDIYNEKFKKGTYDTCASNCADAGLFALDYFCPDISKKKETTFSCTYLALCCKDVFCCLCYILTCSMSCAEVSCINTPGKLYEEARRRAANYTYEAEFKLTNTLTQPLLTGSIPPRPQMMV